MAPVSNLMAEAQVSYDALRKELASPSADLAKCGALVSKLKLTLVQMNYLTLTGPQKPATPALALVRDILETAALYAVRVKDVDNFERYVAQLKTYYAVLRHELPESPRMYLVLGLNLLHLLAQGRIAAFHTEIELIDIEQLTANVYIKHSCDVERCLMEGSYNKLWNARRNAPAEEYHFFMEVLMTTIREEIAKCFASAYVDFPVQDAVTMLHLENAQAVAVFAKEHNWTIKDGKIGFRSSDDKTDEIPAQAIINNALSYTRELERIV
ncbi:hypothetical protein CXG81DRAFT_11157 [Caulochytrium protostelioides]|uniref:26S proteasome non-ATPase regulatory subunit 8 n=1 Tax=Caulochytrium protostelioides TaxID=1555241 RepID=A0A4P9WUY4_9FUNG|nr:26S proteasome non-ATPase regulatory subunit 8 [Caulochytrium protostelioides]RKP02124.1 hypothetical protein CXG81DRAFT_11157 [Caulochytrium protostelioides]|eukprot:RKP02124.1 hypothetical protein CXG81DRAFT_11157 [Caulochytrium protostelioides]